MTADQFAALAQLLRIRAGTSRAAAELVLVHGARKADAARQAGCTPHAVQQVCKRMTVGMELVRRAGNV